MQLQTFPLMEEKMSRLLTRLQNACPLVLDGAMGSELYQAGLEDEDCAVEWNLSRPERVQAIHQSYVEAGAECLLTNTFQANPCALVPFGIEDQLVPILRSGIQIAQKAAGADRFVLLSVGPFYVLGVEEELPDWSDFEQFLFAVDDALAALPTGVDGVLFETWSSPRVLTAIERFRQRALAMNLDCPILLSLSYHRTKGELVTFSGHRPETFARHAEEHGASVIGVNCGREIGLKEIREIVQRYRAVSSLPILVRPNAGTPSEQEGQRVYPLSADVMADWVSELRDLEVTLFGGCCGTTPEHIAAMTSRVQD